MQKIALERLFICDECKNLRFCDSKRASGQRWSRKNANYCMQQDPLLSGSEHNVAKTQILVGERAFAYLASSDGTESHVRLRLGWNAGSRT